ncbi:TetR family transcriptional regulator [Actinocorallia herbida]|uniref:TetR family transcriptional regulator n=1 Tax=Actinocorallia herbida TaxID=58109 RepID=A0A3N1CZF2_9ACTN|nr:TetR/AcrR family transcriptional regulator [Actinocorallia herbida]ROO86673.1 TetR family transcriptional regulator [Actinocorallia herbida]
MRADAERNRRAILSAAYRLIVENGADQVSMNDIAAEAGVGKGTLFRRFTDREGLIAAVFEQLTQDWAPGALARLDDRSVPPVPRILRFVAELYDRMTVPGRPLLRAMSGGPGAERIRHYVIWQRHMAEVVAEARPDLRAEDAEFVAHSILNLPRGQFVDLLVETQGRSPEEIREGIIRVAHLTLTGAPLPDDAEA